MVEVDPDVFRRVVYVVEVVGQNYYIRGMRKFLEMIPLLSGVQAAPGNEEDLEHPWVRSVQACGQLISETIARIADPDPGRKGVSHNDDGSPTAVAGGLDSTASLIALPASFVPKWVREPRRTPRDEPEDNLENGESHYEAQQ